MRVALIELLLLFQSFRDHGRHLLVHLSNQSMFLFILIDFVSQKCHGLVNNRFVKLQLVSLPLYVLSQVVHLLRKEVHQSIL